MAPRRNRILGVSWQRSYVAMATLLGTDPIDGLPEDARAYAEPLVRDLANPDRAARAKVLAAELSRLAHALEELELGAT